MRCIVPHNFSYEHQFDVHRPGGIQIIGFGREINDERFCSSEKLVPGRTYTMKIYMATRWTTTKTCVNFCNAQKKAILAGPHGLLVAVFNAEKKLPICKLLTSFDKNDGKKRGEDKEILSAGMCNSGGWALNIHRGEWAPGTFFVLFFE